MNPIRSLAFLVLLPFAANAADEVVTDPELAGPDFAVQGEYAGGNHAAQVIALGGGKFHLVGWNHGLPGTSPEVEKVTEVDALREGDKIVFKGEKWQVEIVAGELIGKDENGQELRAKRIIRESPTLLAKPPEGALVLFDGTTDDAWEGGKLLPGGLLQMGTKTKQSFGDCTLHLEFRLPFKPLARGQQRGNSGVYLQDRYEVQVLDSFGLPVEDNHCGGIYQVAKPKVNLCFPPLQWQTYDIDFTAAKYDATGMKTHNAVLTVKHNGVLIQDHVEVPHATPSSGHKEGPEEAPLYLQDHNNPVVYRNIWIIAKKG